MCMDTHNPLFGSVDINIVPSHTQYKQGWSESIKCNSLGKNAYPAFLQWLHFTLCITWIWLSIYSQGILPEKRSLLIHFIFLNYHFAQVNFTRVFWI